jgi:Transposase DDE domain
MLDGSLQSVVDVEKLNICLLQAAIPWLEGRSIVVVIHDCSSICKPHSLQQEGLGLVKNLDNEMVKGYDTFNSILIDLKGRDVRLIKTTPFSNGDNAFVSVKERYLYDNGQLRDAVRREEIANHDVDGTSYNLKSLVHEQVKAIHNAIRETSPNALIIDLFDRGFDDADLFELETAENTSFIVRGKSNRNNDYTTSELGVEPQIVQKLAKQDFKHQFERKYQKVSLKGKIYQDAKAVIEYTPICIKDKWYSAVRITFFDRKGGKIFKEPMLLITNLEVNQDEMALLVYEIYLQRSAIEAVFRFCKQELGWQTLQITNWEAIKNLLAFVFMLSAYFYEIKDQIVDDPTCQWLAQLGGGKKTVSAHFLLLGLAKIANYLEIQRLIDSKEISEEDINKAKSALKAKN